MFRTLSGIFIKGVLTILPIVITAGLILWLVDMFEFFFGGLLHYFVPHSIYHFGMGFGLGIIVIFLIGLLVQLWLGQKIFALFEGMIKKIPFVKEIYQPVKHLQNMLVKSDQPKKGKAVIVTIKEGVEMVGIVMNENPATNLNRKDSDKVAVLLPWSYQMGGFTVLVEKSAIMPLDITVEQAFKFSITAGITVEKK